MTPVGIGPASLTPTQQVTPQAKTAEVGTSSAPLKVEQNTVTLSNEGKALLAALQELEKESKPEKSVGDKVESFAAGALGMDHPDTIKEEEDDSYSAGQFVSAAATIGGLLLMLA
ncbi:hypothetical protein EGH82_13275 [Vibrio ponticus]|uniref:Uncharacterized protein n=1 Tax=Vibrio ponticus TaxID=265668 RepID=A0A3N3DYE1_9VIBR|nr:hypothetical protein [Vibrio ponticus]ROV59523.1 hypothetical protein EGH82_13275 [Vibrio ponticus]